MHAHKTKTKSALGKYSDDESFQQVNKGMKAWGQEVCFISSSLEKQGETHNVTHAISNT